VFFDKLVDPPKYGQLSRRGQGRLGFVEDVQAIPTEPVKHEREEGFSVRLLVK